MYSKKKPESGKKTLIVLTSGGDAPGMNPTLRGVVRCWVPGDNDHFVIAARNGYNGLVKRDFEELDRKKVGGLISRGGTEIGAGRCEALKDFDSQERIDICSNLSSIKEDLAGIVVIGGNGSFCGMENIIKDKCRVNACGIPATIDNDIWGTDFSLGVDTALNTNIELIDKIRDTASAFRRAFVIEVMGRDCGYLSLMTAIATEAEAVFLPEDEHDFKALIAIRDNLNNCYDEDALNSTIIVAEGAKLNYSTINDFFESYSKWEVRSVVPGYVQRGGSPSAMDRILGCQLAYKAVEFLESHTGPPEAKVVAIKGTKVEPESDVSKIVKKSGKKARKKDKKFKKLIELQKTLSKYNDPLAFKSSVGGALLVIHGADAPGTNAAIHSFVRTAMEMELSGKFKGFRTIAVRGGFKGLLSEETDFENFVHLSWLQTVGLTYTGGVPAQLAQRNIKPIWASPRNWTDNWSNPKAVVKKIKYNIKRYQEKMLSNGNRCNINCLIVIGGRDAIESIRLLRDGNFSRPIIYIPASIDNDIPQTDYSIGFDTALNSAIKTIDKIKTTALAEGRVFLVETMGGGSGFLPLSIGIASGAEHVFIPELFKTEPNPKDMQEVIDIIDLRFKTKTGKPRKTHAILVFHEAVIEALEGIAKVEEIFKSPVTEAPPPYEVRKTVLGYAQRGGHPSAFDRILATCMGNAAAMALPRALKKSPDGYAMGLENGIIKNIPLEQFLNDSIQKDNAKLNRMIELVNIHIKLARDEWVRNRQNNLDILSISTDTYNPKKPIRDLWQEYWRNRTK